VHSASVSVLFYSYVSPPSATYTLSLHDALPICLHDGGVGGRAGVARAGQRELLGRRRPAEVEHRLRLQRLVGGPREDLDLRIARSEEHTSELQSRENLVCRLLLEKKKQQTQRSS